MRPAEQTFRGGRVRFKLTRELTRGLQRVSREESATLFMTMLTGFAALLGRYTGEREVMIGTPVAARNRVESEGLIGFFVNTLVVRAELGGDPTGSELVGRVRQVCLEAYAHQEVPFERLVEELQVERTFKPRAVVSGDVWDEQRGAGAGGVGRGARRDGRGGQRDDEVRFDDAGGRSGRERCAGE